MAHSLPVPEDMIWRMLAHVLLALQFCHRVRDEVDTAGQPVGTFMVLHHNLTLSNGK